MVALLLCNVSYRTLVASLLCNVSYRTLYLPGYSIQHSCCTYIFTMSPSGRSSVMIYDMYVVSVCGYFRIKHAWISL